MYERPASGWPSNCCTRRAKAAPEGQPSRRVKMGRLRLLCRVTVFAQLLLVSLAVRAGSVATPLFAIDVPDGWTIEDDESSVVLIMGDRVRDGAPAPFLSVQYCFANEPAKGSRQVRCDKPCSQERFDSMAEAGGMQFSPVVKDESVEGVTQYRTYATSPPDASAFAALLCSQNGQVYIALVSDESRKEAEAIFDEVVSSLRWNQPQRGR
jgi:hypothetical protein